MDVDVGAWVGGDGEVDGGVRVGAFVGGGVVVLDEGGVHVEVGVGGVPADEDLSGIGAEVEREHSFLILNVDFYCIVFVDGVADGEGGVDGDGGIGGRVFAAGAEEGADDTLLV